MKKLKKYLFIMITMVVAFFAMNVNVVSAEGEETPEVLDKVVINPNSSTGKPTNVYTLTEEVPPQEEGGTPTQVTKEIQFVVVRDITVAINLEETELSMYDNMFEVCEVIPVGSSGSTRESEECVSHLITKQKNTFQLRSENDGEKKLKIYFFNKTNTDHLKSKDCVSYEKKIYLDTTGPVISLNGGEYVFLPLGSSYQELGAVCADESPYTTTACVVTPEKANINMSHKGYQYVRYTAEDFLGNQTNVVRKVMVELDDGKVDYTYWFYAGGGIVVLSIALVYIVVKNKDKQKRESSVL